MVVLLSIEVLQLNVVDRQYISTLRWVLGEVGSIVSKKENRN